MCLFVYIVSIELTARSSDGASLLGTGESHDSDFLMNESTASVKWTKVVP
jgi:hypothetical protein